MYQVLSISKIHTSISYTTDNFDGIECTVVVRKVENFIILPLFHIVSATKVCNITIFYKMHIYDKCINVQEFKELHSLSASYCHSLSDKYLSKILISTIFKMAA